MRWTLTGVTGRVLAWPDDENPDLDPYMFTESDLASVWPDALDSQVEAAFDALVAAIAGQEP